MNWLAQQKAILHPDLRTIRLSYDHTCTNKCLDNFLVKPKVYLDLKQGSQVMPPFRAILLIS
jgi:hypothetical protein